MQGSVVASCKDGLKWLGDNLLISWDKDRKTFVAEALGKATLAAGLDPDQACLVYKVHSAGA